MKTVSPSRPGAGPAGPRIDPRIRQRRIEVTRDQGRRRLRVLVAVASVAVAVALGVVVLHLSWFRIHTVRVVGARHTTDRQIAAAAAPALHQPILSADTSLVVARVDRLPWVESARVGKSWPATLVVTVVERTAVAQVAAGSRWALVDRAGRVLEVQATRDPTLVTLAWSGPVGGPGSLLAPAARAPLAVASALGPLTTAGPDDPAPVISVGTQPGGGVVLGLAGGAGAQIGAPDQLAAKLTALRALESEVDLSGVRTIDLTVPGQPVLTRG